MSLSSLTLYTPDNSVSLVHAELTELIRSIGLTGKPIGSFQFLAGNHFFSHITFLGCAPNISLQPEQGPHYLRISVPPQEKPVLLSGTRAPAPLCTTCKQPIEHWKLRIKAAQDEAINCHHCQGSIPVADLNFRKRACFSRNIIRIEPVFESEAIPAGSFLDTLNTTFDVDFEYAYIDS